MMDGVKDRQENGFWVRLVLILAVGTFLGGCSTTSVNLEKLDRAVDECFSKTSFVQCMKAKGYLEGQ